MLIIHDAHYTILSLAAVQRRCVFVAGEDDRHSVGSAQSSSHSFDMKSTVSAPVIPIPRRADGSPLEGAAAAHGRKESTRRRKLGVIGQCSNDVRQNPLASSVKLSQCCPILLLFLLKS